MASPTIKIQPPSRAFEWPFCVVDYGCSWLEGVMPPPSLINGRRNKGYMILAWSIDRYNWCLSTSLEIAKGRFMVQALCVNHKHNP